MISTLRAILKKEWRDSIRDRRSMSAAFLFAISGPILIALLIANTAERESSDQPIEVAVRGGAGAPDLFEHLRRHRVETVEAGGSAAAAEPAGVSLLIPEDYQEKLEAGLTVAVAVVADRSRPESRRAAQRLQDLVQGYSASLGQLRLALRGVAPSVGRPIVVDARDLATRAARASDVLGVLTIYFLLSAFIGSMAVSIDVAAGERERNSLEVLMAQPISSLAVFAGKTLVASAFGALGIALTLVVSKLAFVKVPLADIGLSWTLSWIDSAYMLLGLLPLAVMVAALQIALSLWAKTFKEASAYLNMLILLPMAMAMVVMIKEIEAAAWMYAVPLLGHQQWLRSMIRAETVEPMLVGLLATSTLALAGLLVVGGGVMLTRERIVFGQSD